MTNDLAARSTLVCRARHELLEVLAFLAVSVEGAQHEPRSYVSLRFLQALERLLAYTVTGDEADAELSALSQRIRRQLITGEDAEAMTSLAREAVLLLAEKLKEQSTGSQ